MNKIKKKLNKKGFTLAELLIVVAIIAVLVAVSVPIFSSKLEKAKEATDVANMRAAKAAAVSEYLSGDFDPANKEYLYDADAGLLRPTTEAIAGYGQGTGTDGGVKYDNYDNSKPYKDQIIKVTITAETKSTEPAIVVEWVPETKK